MSISLQSRVERLEREIASLKHLLGLNSKPLGERTEGDWKDVLLDLARRGKQKSMFFAESAKRAGFASTEDAVEWASLQPQTPTPTREGWGE